MNSTKIVIFVLSLFLLVWGGMRFYFVYINSAQDCVTEMLPSAEVLSHNRETSSSCLIDKYTLSYSLVKNGVFEEADSCYIDGKLIEVGRKWFAGNRFYDVSLIPAENKAYVGIYTYDPIVKIIKAYMSKSRI